MRALVLLAFASCGFAGEDDFKGHRFGAGDAPWTSLGSVSMCMTPTLLGPPDTDPVGICLGQSAAPSAGCRADGDCRSRERCVCGLCVAQFCDGPGQCGIGKECNFRTSVCGVPCSSSEPCPGDADLCDRGFCTLRCMTDAECQSGEFCSTTHRCTATSCKVEADCIAGVQTCAIQRNPQDLREPALLESPLVLFVELRPALSTGEIWRATTSDGGQSWRMDPPQAVLVPQAGERRVGAPAVAKRGGQLLMFFENDLGGIFMATSNDEGRTFARAGSPGTGSSPGVAVLDDGTILLYYEAAGAISLAISTDGTTFTDKGAVLTPATVSDPLLWRFIDRVGQPAARRGVSAGREIVQLWFTGHGVETSSSIQSGMPTPPVPNDSIGYAVSTDRGRTFSPYPFNPVFDRIENFVDHDQESAPAVASLGDGFLLIYGAADTHGISSGLGAAVNP